MTRLTKFSNTELLSLWEEDRERYETILDRGEDLARMALYNIFSDYQLGVISDSLNDYDQGQEYLEAVLVQELVKPSDQVNIIEQIKGKLISLNKEGSNRVTQEQKYYALYIGYRHYIAGTMIKSFSTFDTKELRKVSKSIPYL